MIQTSRERVEYAKELVHCWYEAWDGQVYVSWSGGMDSTVLKHIVHSLYPDVPSVFVNTGLEWPEIVSFVKKDPDVVIIRPKKSFRWVIENKGYPVISKEQSQYIKELRNTKSDKLRNIRMNGNASGNGKVSNKWKFLVEAPFKISDECCRILKKEPFKRYEKESGRHPMIGNRAAESVLRRQHLKRYSCNSYELRRPISRPLSLLTSKDILKYIKEHNVEYSKIYDMGYDRTGCMFCMFGLQTEKYPTRFDKMSLSHPQQYKFCMEKLGLHDVISFISQDKQLKLF